MAKWNKSYIKKIDSLLRAGFTIDEACKALEISKPTLYNWQEKHVEFFTAIKNARMNAETEVVDALYKRAVGYSITETKEVYELPKGTTEGKPILVKREINTKHYPPSEFAAQFLLCNRFKDRWKAYKKIDPSPEEETDDFNLNIKIS